jgi:Mn-dependent DtxR family transcriptional regulator
MVGQISKTVLKFRNLECFVAAAEELNFTHAASRLHVSQPSFSKQIRDLEGELGIDLFERHRKGVALTPAGKSFLIDAEESSKTVKPRSEKPNESVVARLGNWPLAICPR